MRERRRAGGARLPSAEELALWQAAMRDTRPLDGRAPTAKETAVVERSRPPPSGARRAEPAPAAAPPRPRLLDPTRPVDLDRRTWQRLRRGRMPIEATLDLHGMTQQAAHEALAAFVARMQARGARCVLVITGRGLRVGGVLRRMVPRWLDSPPLRDWVLAYGPARIEHGGEGALYVLLRRQRR